jgi:hypothetical protein
MFLVYCRFNNSTYQNSLMNNKLRVVIKNDQIIQLIDIIKSMKSHQL